MVQKIIFQGIKEGQKRFFEDIAVIINSILLSIAYFIGVGFTYLVSRVFHKNFLDIKKEKDKNSYWEELNLQLKSKGEYYRQF